MGKRNIMRDHAVDRSDYRAHVVHGNAYFDPIGERVVQGWVFIAPSQAWREAAKQGKPAKATQGNVGFDTSKGILVTPTQLELASGHSKLMLGIPGDLMKSFEIKEDDPEGSKGFKATQIISEMARRGLLRLPARVERTAKQEDIEGVDLIVSSSWKIQVKCDLKGGYTGSGYLYYETAEVNPFRIH